jgi:hypothetical protein
MTHSLHRTGSKESLRDDLVFLSQPAMGINSDGAAEKFKRITDLLFEVGPANIGSYEAGNVFTGITAEDIKKRCKDNSRVRCAFDNKEKLKKILGILKEEDLGICITVSGLIDDIREVAQEVGLNLHSINLSCGVHGHVERLPEPEIMEITTMCGHAMIGASIVRKMILDVKRGRRSMDDAVAELAKPCVCGIFNPVRARRLLQKLIKLWTLDGD